jgi:hypothetical protein
VDVLANRAALHGRCVVTDEQSLLGAYPDLIRRGIFRGVDLTVLRDRFWRLEAMRADNLRSPPQIRWRAYNANWIRGMAHTTSHQITMRIGQDASVEDAAEVLLHEMVHCSCPAIFCRRLIACAREAFGLDLDTAALLSLPPGQKGKRAYAIDDAIKATMIAAGVGARLRADPATRFDPPPPEDPAVVEARRAAQRLETAAVRVATREKHAREKLVEWERRLAAARKKTSEWRKKVRYYERRAAKRPEIT